MADMRTGSQGRSTQRRAARTRERGMRSVSVVTRMAVSASLLLAAALSVVAAIGFTGHTNATATGASSGTTSARGSSNGQRVALPPTGDGGVLSPPFAPPVSQPVQQPPVTSGGS